MGTIHAAARKLYISPQSLSQHIKKLEEELGAQLFHRDNPMTLTAAGLCVERAARDTLSRVEQLELELAELKGSAVKELTIGVLDYGIPDFLPPLMDLFLRRESNTILKTREIPVGEPIPQDVPLLISTRELGGHYKSEVLFVDQLVVCVSDDLLKRCYGEDWQAKKEQLSQGDLCALEDCPFVQHRNTPLETLSEIAFSQHQFVPQYLPILGAVNATIYFCISGQAAMVTFAGQSQINSSLPPAYPIHNMPDAIPAGYICYRSDTVLSTPAQQFLAITRHYFRATPHKC